MPFANLVREISPVLIDPVADRFIENVGAAFVKQIFSIPQDSKNRTYIMTASWIISSDVLN
ncbi:hypothetical protein HAD_10850 [Hyphomonas adhaerens MHS-3]|uniref:Uncharacterized protein n=1 Tax=Hyphomonas adhaerens MHS-3 TaxID=1280949 RepID=A0A069E897_9PROT|nr:hypothetical protein HAD_10850 [Hyphomonas adhaerens MHS-3]